MKTIIKSTRRIAAIVFSLALLCGVVAGTSLFVSANETEVTKYAVDFRDLATVATNAGKDVSAGYKATAADTAINDWVNARFGGLHSWDYGTSHQMNCIGDSTQDKYWLITENGLKGSDKDYCWHATYGIALTLKQDNEYLQLKNFEASLVFNTDGNNAGNVFISFHEPAAGNVGTSPSQVFTPVGDIALSVTTINCAGIVGSYYDCQGIEVGAAGVPLASNDKWGSSIAAADRFHKDGAETTLGQYNDYKLNVKVVNGTATITVTDMNGTVYGSKTTAVSDKAGTISIGTAARSRVLKSIKVTELDEDGIPVDLGTYANPVEDPITVNQFKVDFADLAAKVDDAAYTDSLYTPAETDTELDAWVLEKFGMTYNREGHTFADRAHLGTVIDTKYGHGNTYWLIDKNGYLQKNGTINGGEMYRDMELLTVKGSDGEYAVLDNFEARIVFKNTTNGRGVVGVFFNEQVPGKMAFYSAHADYLKQDAVLVGVVSDTAPNGGITVKGSGDNLGDYICDMKEDFAASAPMTSGAAAVDHEMIVKVIGSDVYVKVTTPSTGAVLWEKTYAGAVKGATGTVSIGVGKSSRAIKSVTITQLDEAGLPVDFQVQKDNTVKVSGKTLTVKAGEGYELKAGSLIVTDAKGATILPQRVGYREGGNADKYTIPAEAVAPYTVDYEFIKPGDESGYNVGFLGTSVYENEEQDGGDLRFVYRLNIDKDGKALYNEEKVTVKEYGLLLASAAILPNAADLDIETAEDSMHVHQFKWPASNRYYDKCDDYVDIAVQINGIPESAADMDLHTRAYIVLENDDVVYMNPKTENYEDASSTYVTEKVVDLLASNRLRTIGRQEVTAEKLVMEYNNAAVVISGELKDSVVMRMANTSSANSIVHVIVDGNVSDEKTIVLSGNSVQDVVLCGGLQKGNHTIEVIRGTCTDWSTLDLYSVTYNGTLTAPMTRDLQIEFLGDSITCAMGAIESNGTYNYGSSWQDGFHSYAAITARNLNADASMLSVSGMTTQQVYEKFDDVKRHVNDGAWNFAANPQDIVVINLGTNDQIFGVADADVATTCANLLRDVRNTYGKDTYIVWAYGMMYDGNIENYKKAVRNFNDERTLFCDLSPAKNTAGWGGHPNEAGQAAAAAILTAFLRDNCLA